VLTTIRCETIHSRDECVYHYTIRNNSKFDQTKIRLSVNNLWNSHYEYSDTPGGPLVIGTPISANGATYTNPSSHRQPHLRASARDGTCWIVQICWRDAASCCQ